MPYPINGQYIWLSCIDCDLCATAATTATATNNNDTGNITNDNN